MAKVLVTGVAGFIGSHIAERLLRSGNNTVIGIDDLSAGYLRNIPEGVIYMQADVCNIAWYESIMKDVDVVFHNAASKKNICMKDPARDMEVNGIGTLRLLQSSIQAGVKKFIHASTGSVYGEVKGQITEHTSRVPVSYYGISKLAGESYVQYFHDYYGLNTTILRYFHVYGERQDSKPGFGGVVAIFSDKILKGLPIEIDGDGGQSRVFTHVSDIVQANIMSWHSEKSRGQVYNCASSELTTISELAVMLMEKHKKKVSITYDAPLPGDIYNFDVSTTKIESELGIKFNPISKVL